MGIGIFIPGADFSSLNLGQVTPLQDIPVTALAIVMNASYSAATFTPAITYTPSNSNKKGVTWEITAGGTYATIDATTGVVTILSNANGNSITIKATSTTDNTITATASTTVTYKDTVDSLTAIAISGAASVGETGATYTASYTPSNTSYPGVTWSITAGSAYASINANTGVLTAIGNGSVTIQATSTHDSSIVATKTVTVAATATDDTIINFADAAVKAICVANCDTNADGEITVGEAKLYGHQNGDNYTPGSIFNGNTAIQHFSELKYFTKINNFNSLSFNGCSNLIDIKLPSSTLVIDYDSFKNCTSLTEIDIPANCVNIGNSAFYNCTSLTKIILRQTVIPSLGTNIFGNSTCPIYVEDSIYDTYKSDTNFSQYSTRIAKISTMPA